MVGVQQPLVGNAIVVSDGAAWRRQRAIDEPAFSHRGVPRALRRMAEAIELEEARLEGLARAPESVRLTRRPASDIKVRVRLRR